MRNIFKRQNDSTIKIFENWDEVEMNKIKEKIKKQKTEELKEWMHVIKKGLVIGIRAAILGVIIGLILEELSNRK